MKADKPIITSLLDNDLYKFTMQQTMLHHFGDAKGEYAFKCRTPRIDFKPIMAALREELQALGQLKMQFSELQYLKTLPFIKPNYLSFLEDFRLNPEDLSVDIKNGELSVRAKGPITRVMMFEIFVLAIVQELWMRHTHPEVTEAEGRGRLADKIDFLEQSDVPDFKFADFGTRRRFSKHWHYQVVRTLKQRVPQHFVGTSNVYLAKEFGVKPIGTMAHEYLQAFQGFTHPEQSQTMALETWVQEYRGDLGIALTDVLGMDMFLQSLDLYFGKLFDGFRHDSGCPKVWCKKLLNHLKNHLGIDPKTKTAVFSDGLDFQKAIDLHKAFHEQINTSFGIGTYLTNDMGVKALSNVMKLVALNGRPVAKMPDSAGKTMCEDMDYVAYLEKLKMRHTA
ncbi:nicotinate phosphoribosyltransferase [Pleionea mediterranea]|uniref:Nicotinate phosphoribosyltransferase n=1 Tax=Pleionea mediterranea TaxID=523701 RepID=A0A316FLU8_9GAMM|nr:nicotinate phosphoribosyltransferase [Pleionea mediterranea]PWK49868.1 nicotinate phosphoribosyltransferase [Pleionea mediterranea]